jgi:hypothetical protein
MNAVKAKLLVVRRHWTQVGEERERERIIKLLEDNYPGRLSGVIKLIKGETNG